MKTIAIALLAVLAVLQTPALGQVSRGPLPQEVIDELLLAVYIPPEVKSKISITFVGAPTLAAINGTGLGTYQSLKTYVQTPQGFVEARELRRGAINVAVGGMRTIEGAWDIPRIADTLAHEIGHAVWDLMLSDAAKAAFRKVTPELHEQPLSNVQSKSDYLWQTHREEYFAETWKVLLCMRCSLLLSTHWRFPVTPEVIAFFKQHVGQPLREPAPEETVP